MPTAKHFPGRGDSILDAHDTLDVSRKSMDELRAVEIMPYVKLMEADTPFAIMTAHNAYTAIDGEDVPASLSRKIYVDLIREEMGFDGVVTTDAIGMAGAIAYAGGSEAKASVMALIAGADLVLLKSDEPTSVEAMELTAGAVGNGDLTETELDEKVRRILTAKFALGLFDASPLPEPDKAREPVFDPETIDVCCETFEKGSLVTRDRDGLLPLAPDTKVLVVEQHIPLYHEKCNDRYYHPGMFGEYMRQYGPAAITSVETDTPANDEQARQVAARFDDADVIVFSNIFWRGSGSNRPLIREAVSRGRKVVVATNDLYDSYFLPTAGTIVCTFGAVPRGLETAARIICGDLKPQGSWPLRTIAMEDTVSPEDDQDHFIAGHFSVR